jgi:flagellar biosynthesis regulator FlaF
MGFDIRYKKIDTKEFIKTHLNNIMDTIRNGGQIDAETWAEFIDDTIKEENTTIEEILNANRMISIKPDIKHSSCRLTFLNGTMGKDDSNRGFTKKELGEFIESLQLVHNQLKDNIKL